MITSHQNPLIKQIKRLQQKKYRLQEQAFFAEGLRVVLTAIEHNAPIQTLIYAPDLLTSNIARQVLAEQTDAGLSCVPISSELFTAISGRDNPTGLGAIIQTTWPALDSLTVQPEDLWLALVEISDPGNLGTILRTADSFGAAGIILAGRTVDPFHPTAVKASMGSLFTLRLAQTDNPGDLIHWAAQNQIQTIATSAKASQPIRQAAVRHPLLLILGSEGEGLPPDMLAAADLQLTIPIHGTTTSLNLAVAAGILLYELGNQSFV